MTTTTELDIFANSINAANDGEGLTATTDFFVFYVAPDVIVAGENGNAGVDYSGGHTLTATIDGAIFGSSAGFYVHTTTLSSTLTIDPGGSIVSPSGTAAIFVQDGASTIINEGTVSGLRGIDEVKSTGISTIQNSGTINGSSVGVALSDSTSGDSVQNSGTIQGGTAIAQGAASFMTVTNSGQLTGALAGVVFDAASGTDRLFNSGTIVATQASSTGVNETGLGTLDVDNSGTIQAMTAGIISSGNGIMSIANEIGGLVSGATGIQFHATGDQLMNAGTIDGTVTGVLESSVGSLAVTNRGVITGFTGISFQTNSGGFDTLINSGTIDGFLTAAVSEGNGGALDATNTGQIVGHNAIVFATVAGLTTIDNGGLIKATGSSGIAVDNAGNSAMFVNNSGTISGSTAIVFAGGGGQSDTLDNSGVIRTTLVNGGAVTETGNATFLLTNSGHIAGRVTFGGGSDVYDGALGNVTGLVFGNTGNDTLTGGAGTDHLDGGTGNDVLDGMAGNDVLAAEGANAVIDGGDGNDIINMASFLNAGDQIDGGAGRDTLLLSEDLSAGFVFSATTLVNVEKIVLGNGFSYSLTTDDATVAAGATLAVDGSALTGNTLTFNGSAETDGHFVLTGGTSNDVLTGGAGNDMLTGNAGNNLFTGGMGADHIVSAGGHDHFIYNDVSESTGLAHDVITGFNALEGKFDLDVTVTGINSEVTSGRLSTANFDANLATAIGSAQLAAGHAVLFTPTVGNLAGHTLLIVDANGVAGYQAGQDYVFDLVGATHLTSLATTDFI